MMARAQAAGGPRVAETRKRCVCAAGCADGCWGGASRRGRRGRRGRAHQTKVSFSGMTVRQAAWYVTSCGLSESTMEMETPRCRSRNELRPRAIDDLLCERQGQHVIVKCIRTYI